MKANLRQGKKCHDPCQARIDHQCANWGDRLPFRPGQLISLLAVLTTRMVAVADAIVDPANS